MAERGIRQYGDVPERLAAFEARRTPGQHAAPGSRPAPSPSATAFSQNFLPAASPAAFGQPLAADADISGTVPMRAIANPVRGDRLVAGMPVRVPKANLLPGSVGGGPRAAGPPSAGYEEQPTVATLPQRSPEKARSRLSGFQRGARRAQSQAPHAAERADR